jgi:hypothetical protein
MKKALAAVLVVALATVGMATMADAAGKKQVETRVRIAYDARGSTAPDFDVAVFLGTVRADRKTCRSGRKVTVSTISGQSVGSDKASDGGKFEVDASGFGPGNYVVKVHKKKTPKVICRGTSKSFKAR